MSYEFQITFYFYQTDDATKIGEVYSMSSKQSITSHVNQIMGGKSSTLSISADEDVSYYI